MMLLPVLTMQAQTVLTPEQQLEDAQKALEQAKKALEEAKARAEAEKANAKAEAAKVKAEQIRAQAEKVKAETEKVNAEAERMKAMAEKMKAEAEKVKAEAEKANAEKEQQAETSNGWMVPVAVPTKKETEKKVEKNADGAVLKVDAKYLADAVPTNASGKVEFTLETDANGKSIQQIYDIVFAFMSELTQQSNNIASRVALVYNKKGERIIVNTMDEWLVFSQSFISLDRTEAKYTLMANISDNHLRLSMSSINYNYEQGRATGFKEPAEKVITDKVALNKKKTNLAKTFGKFRRLTIDRKDEIFGDITARLKK